MTLGSKMKIFFNMKMRARKLIWSQAKKEYYWTDTSCHVQMLIWELLNGADHVVLFQLIDMCVLQLDGVGKTFRTGCMEKPNCMNEWGENKEVGEMKLQWSVSVFPFLPTWYFNVSCTLTPLWYLNTTNSKKSKFETLENKNLWAMNNRKSKSNYHFLVQEMSPSWKVPSAFIFLHSQYQYKASY